MGKLLPDGTVQLHDIDEELLINVCDQIREYEGSEAPIKFKTVPERYLGLLDRAEYWGKDDCESDQKARWERPEGWPNLDIFDTSIFAKDWGLWTIDNTDRRACIDLQATNANRIAFYSWDADTETFTLLEENRLSTNTVVIRDFSTWDYDYIVLAVSSTGTTGLSRISFNNMPTTDAKTGGVAIKAIDYPLVETIVYMPNFTSQNRMIAARCRRAKIIGISKLTSMSAFFGTNSGDSRGMQIEEIELVDCDTSKVTNMDYCFNQCYWLRNIIGIETLATANVTSMAYTFKGVNSLTELDLSAWNTAKVKSFNYFASGAKLKKFKFAFDFRSATALSYFLTEAYNLYNVDFSHCQPTTPGLVTTYQGFMQQNWKLKSIDLHNLFDLSGATTVSLMFYQDFVLEEIKGLRFNVSSTCTNINNMVYNCRALRELDLRGGDLGGVTNLSNGKNGGTYCLRRLYIDGVKSTTKIGFADMHRAEIIDCTGSDFSGGSYIDTAKAYFLTYYNVPGTSYNNQKFAVSNRLTKEAVELIVDCLKPMTSQTSIAFGYHYYNMSDEYKQLLASKNWKNIAG